MPPLHIESPRSFRRLIIVLAVLLIALEFGAFWFAARLTMLLRPPDETDLTALSAFIAFWSVLTLQAMGIVGIAWMAVAVAWTTLDGDEHLLTLTHPWRRWSGYWADIAEGYVSGGWLHLRVRGRVRTWHVRLSPETHQSVAVLQGRLPSDVWLSEPQVRAVLLKRMLPALIIGTAVGAGAILMLDQWIERSLGSR